MSKKKTRVAMLEKLKIDSKILEKIGAIVVLSGIMEFVTERAVWSISGEDPTGKHPSTDGKKFSDLLKIMKAEGQKSSQPSYRKIITLWVDVADYTFRCRNTIFHGLIDPFEGAERFFVKNTQWGQVKRKFPSSTFHATENTLNLLLEVMEGLLELAVKFTPKEKPFRGHEKFEDALKRSNSIIHEIENLTAAINSEKY